MAVADIDAYLANLDEPKRSVLQQLRKDILAELPDAEECISYGTPAFKIHGKVVAGFAAFKNHLSYLPHSGSVFAALESDLAGYEHTKGALHFPIDRTLPQALVGRLIATRLAQLDLADTPRPDPRPGVPIIAGRHPGVDTYIATLPAWQQDLCQELRELIHGAEPDIAETIKRSVQPYFVRDGNVCALLATQDHVNLFLYDPSVPDPDRVINQGNGNATARAIQIYQGESVNRSAISAIVQAIAARNRAGGWRRLNTGAPPQQTRRLPDRACS